MQYLLMVSTKSEMLPARCTYCWVHFPRRKNHVCELSEELLVQKQEWQQRAIEKQKAGTDASVPETAEHDATQEGSQPTQHC